MLPFPLQFIVLLFAGWINRQQLEAIEYLTQENRILKERLGRHRIRFTGVGATLFHWSNREKSL